MKLWDHKLPGSIHISLIKSQNNHSGRESESCSVVSDALQPHGLYSPWNSPGQNTGVGSLSLLQGIFPTQGLNPGLPHCRQILYQLSHRGNPKILEWVAIPFSSRSSWPRNQTGVSCIAGGFLTNWAIREGSSFAMISPRIIPFQTQWYCYSLNIFKCTSSEPSYTYLFILFLGNFFTWYL